MNTTSMEERRAPSGRASTGIALRYAGGVDMAGTLQHDTGEMTWTTDPVAAEPEGADAEAAGGTFAVVDGMLLVAYRSGGTEWLRVGTTTLERADVDVSIEVGLSARELVLVTSGGTIRLRADGDPAAEAFAAEILATRRAA
jgi:hypothetical protein